MSGKTKIFLVILRLAIGWHFLFEGVEKVSTHEGLPIWTPWTDQKEVRDYHSNKPAFTSESYLRESASPGELGKFFRDLPGDSVLERFPTPEDYAAPPDPPPLPAALAKDWQGYFDRFVKYYDLDADQRTRADEVFSRQKEQTALWLYGKGSEKQPTVTHNSPAPPGGAFQEDVPMPERVRQYRDAIKAEQDLDANYATAVGAAADPRVEEAHKHTRELRTKLRADLTGQSKKLMEGLQTLLTPEQQAQRPILEPLDVSREQLARLSEYQRQHDAAIAPAERHLSDYDRLDWIDFLTRWTLVVVGLCLLVGLFTRTACVVGAGFLLLLVLAMLPGPWAPEIARGEGRLIINKNCIEMLALLTLATTCSGRWLGLDALLGRVFRRRPRYVVPRSPVVAVSPAITPRVKEPIHGT